MLRQRDEAAQMQIVNTSTITVVISKKEIPFVVSEIHVEGVIDSVSRRNIW